MGVRRRLAGVLGLTGPRWSMWIEVEMAVDQLVAERDRAVRNVAEMQTFLGQVQLLAYEQGVSELLADFEAALCARSADLPVPILTHVRILADHWRTCPVR